MASHIEAWRRHDIFMNRLGAAVDPVEHNDLERSLNAEIARVDAAERRHLAATHRYLEADRHCSRALTALAEDALDDPTGYTWLVNSGKVSQPVALIGGALPGQLKLIGVAGIAVGALSRLALLVFYDEGSWKEIGVNVLSSAVTTCGSVLVAGSGIGGKVVLEGGKRVFTKTANPTTGFRVGAGVRTTFDDWVTSARRNLGLSAHTARAIPARPLPKAENLVGKARNLATHKVDKAVTNNLKLAMANGKGAQTMFLAGVTTQKAPTLVKQFNSVHDRLVPEPETQSKEKAPAPNLP
jgi:hypothetical protein